MWYMAMARGRSASVQEGGGGRRVGGRSASVQGDIGTPGEVRGTGPPVCRCGVPVQGGAIAAMKNHLEMAVWHLGGGSGGHSARPSHHSPVMPFPPCLRVTESDKPREVCLERLVMHLHHTSLGPSHFTGSVDA